MEPIFSTNLQKHGFTRKAHGRNAPARKSQVSIGEVTKNRSSVFTSQVEDKWAKEIKKISKNAGFRNKGTFTVAQNKLVEPGKSCK